MDGATVEHSARRDAAGLRRPVRGREHRTAGLVPSELLLESAVFLPEGPEFLLEPLGLPELFTDPLLLRRIDRDGLVVLGRGEQDRRGCREKSLLGKRETTARI